MKSKWAEEGRRGGEVEMRRGKAVSIIQLVVRSLSAPKGASKMLRATGHARMVTVSRGGKEQRGKRGKDMKRREGEDWSCQASKTAFRSHCAPYGTLHTCVSEASCPNFEPRAQARLTVLTRIGGEMMSGDELRR